MQRLLIAALVTVACAAVLSCGKKADDTFTNYSCARLDEASVRQMDLDLEVDFARERIRGTAVLSFDNHDAHRLWLDTWDLSIESVRLDAVDGPETTWELGEHEPLVGRPLSIDITPKTRRVAIVYETGDDARGVQWLSPRQTLGKRHPVLYTQSQAILARTWVPCQDTPMVRFRYTASVRVPPGLIALMSARNPRFASSDGTYEFEMSEPIPSYLLALAVGDFAYRAVSHRCGVYAEPELADDALWEFIDMERMTQQAEALYGPYRWEQFDVLVLPPSFPYGGMENPRLTFATPVLVAGDRSLVSTIAHELAHSWSGNLVTNATWEDFWLNEGFTTYFERRIMEELYGRERSEMHALLGRAELEEEIEELGPDNRNTALYIPLEGRDPDVELGTAPYEKGYLFLRLLEETFGRERFDAFLREYFDAHAFETMTTERFLAYLEAELFDADAMAKLEVEEWVYAPGIPDNAPLVQSSRFDHAADQASAFVAGMPADELDTSGFTSAEWQHFLAAFHQPLSHARVAELERTFHLSQGNGEVKRSWFLVVIEADYRPLYPEVETFLLGLGRNWLIKPVYTKLAKTPDGKAFALAVYERARPGYHAVVQESIDTVLGLQDSNE